MKIMLRFELEPQTCERFVLSEQNPGKLAKVWQEGKIFNLS